MRLFGLVDGAVGPRDRAAWLMPPFDKRKGERMRLYGYVSGAIDRNDRAEWLTPPFNRSPTGTETNQRAVESDTLLTRGVDSDSGFTRASDSQEVYQR